ncbi:MAG: F0F1 ATP synthase subunit epsilon [Deltaproteobacteria bacterium]|nr:F0F1 ATP synthase subunit epsilon [Deltaproteobacteria bacterium]
MADELLLEVVTPDRRLLNRKVASVVAPGVMGEFGVLPGHVNFMTLLGTGILGFRTGDGVEALVVSRGYCEVVDNKVTVLAEVADLASEVDVQAAKEDLRQLEEKLKGKGPHDEEFPRLRAEVERATARISLGGGR